MTQVSILAHDRLGVAVLGILQRVQPRLGPEDPVPLQRVAGVVACLERAQVPHHAGHMALIGWLPQELVYPPVELGVVQEPLGWAPVDSWLMHVDPQMIHAIVEEEHVLHGWAWDWACDCDLNRKKSLVTAGWRGRLTCHCPVMQPQMTRNVTHEKKKVTNEIKTISSDVMFDCST